MLKASMRVAMLKEPKCWQTMSAAVLAGKLLKAGVHVLATGPDKIRVVTHLDVSTEQINEAVEIFKKLLTT